MPRIECIVLALCFLISSGPAWAVLGSVTPPATERAAARDKPQLERDLEGLDPRDGQISEGLRGSFIIKHYISGPWKGGTAVIEVASDLSYAEIRIFNQDGNLQRIYSIQPKSQKTRINPSEMQNPARMVEKVQQEDASNQSQAMNVVRSPQREAAVQAQTEQAVEAEIEQRYADEAAAAADGLPPPRPRRGTVSSRAGDIREVDESESRQSTEIASARAVAANASATASRRASAGTGTSESVSTTPKKRVIRVRKKRLRKSSSALDTPLSGSAPASKYEYYYEDVVVTEAQVKPPAQEAAKAEPVQEARVTSPGKSATGPQQPYPQQPYPSKASAAAEQPKQETAREKRKRIKAEEAEQKRAAAAAAAAEKEAAEIAAADTRRGQDLDHSPAHSATQIAQVPAGAMTSTPASTGSSSARPPVTSAYDDANLPDVTQAVQENEKESKQGKKKREPKQESRPEPEQAPVESKRALESDVWKPKPVKEVPLPGEAVDVPPPPPPRTEKAKPPVDETIDLNAAQKAAVKMESDVWSPKPAAAAPTDAELGITNLEDVSGKRPGKSKKVTDDMAGMSDAVKRGGQVAEGSEAWEPKPASKLSQTEEQQLARANNLKASMSSPKPVKMSRDVNNPEEGVLPFYSLEKYSGAQYGRHREFERKVIYKQNKKSPVKGYDFYIDEVDRKSEKHYLYYYKMDAKTKKTKLIATEKHEQVTFLGNYDIGSEDKGKIKYE